MTDRSPNKRQGKQPYDTMAGCKHRAADDLAAAALTDSGNIRRRFEISADSWTARANMLERIERAALARKALAAPKDAEDVMPGQ